jgi:DNA-binding PadR family transcriptional regulator
MGKSYLSYTMALILQVLDHGYRYGFDIMTTTGLASGTVYPALRRLEDAGFVASRWERPALAQAAQRPPRKFVRKNLLMLTRAEIQSPSL